MTSQEFQSQPQPEKQPENNNSQAEDQDQPIVEDTLSLTEVNIDLSLAPYETVTTDTTPAASLGESECMTECGLDCSFNPITYNGVVKLSVPGSSLDEVIDVVLAERQQAEERYRRQEARYQRNNLIALGVGVAAFAAFAVMGVFNDFFRSVEQEVDEFSRLANRSEPPAAVETVKYSPEEVMAIFEKSGDKTLIDLDLDELGIDEEKMLELELTKSERTVLMQACYMLKHGSEESKVFALYVIDNLEGASPPALMALSKAFDDQSPLVREAAAKVLNSYHIDLDTEDSIITALRGLSSPSPEIRTQYLHCLARLDDEVFVQYLPQLMESLTIERYEESLQYRRGESPSDYKQRIREENDYICTALFKLQMLKEKAKPALAVISELSRIKDGRVQSGVISAIEIIDIDYPRLLPIVRRNLTDGEGGMASGSCASVLKKLGPKAKAIGSEIEVALFSDSRSFLPFSTNYLAEALFAVEPDRDHVAWFEERMELAREADSPELELRLVTALSKGKGVNAEAAIPVLLRFFNDPEADPFHRSAAAKAIVSLDPESLKTIPLETMLSIATARYTGKDSFSSRDENYEAAATHLALYGDQLLPHAEELLELLVPEKWEGKYSHEQPHQEAILSLTSLYLDLKNDGRAEDASVVEGLLITGLSSQRKWDRADDGDEMVKKFPELLDPENEHSPILVSAIEEARGAYEKTETKRPPRSRFADQGMREIYGTFARIYDGEDGLKSAVWGMF